MIARIWSIEIWFEFCHVSVFAPMNFLLFVEQIIRLLVEFWPLWTFCLIAWMLLCDRHSKVLIWFLFFHYLLDLLFVLTTYKHFWTHGKKQTVTALQKAQRLVVNLSLIWDKKPIQFRYMPMLGFLQL